MKFTIEDTGGLRKVVEWAAQALPTRPYNPVSAGLLITALDGAVRFSATDIDSAAGATIPAAGAELIPGGSTVLLPGMLLASIIKALPAGQPVTFELTDNGARMTITAARSTFALLTIPGEDYPTIADVDQVCGIAAGDLFCAAVERTAFTASKDGAVPVLAALQILFEDQVIRFGATDRYRLAADEILWTAKPGEDGLPGPVLVPAGVLAKLARLIPDEANVTLSVDSDVPGQPASRLGLAFGDRTFMVRLLDGEFPDYAGFLNGAVEATAVIGAADLVAALNRAGIVTAKGSVGVTVTFDQDGLQIEAGAGEEATASEQEIGRAHV